MSMSMEMVALTPERKAQLEDYALRHGQDAATALDEVLADYLEWESQDHREAVEGIREGYADAKAGRVLSAEDAFEELRVKHGLPR
jgi:predicted transcriptional regulator